MSFIQTIVCRSKDVILCEYTDYEGNFQQVSRVIIPKIKQNQAKGTIIYDK